MSMVLVFVLIWVKSVLRCSLYISSLCLAAFNLPLDANFVPTFCFNWLDHLVETRGVLFLVPCWDRIITMWPDLAKFCLFDLLYMVVSSKIFQFFAATCNSLLAHCEFTATCDSSEEALKGWISNTRQPPIYALLFII